MHRQLTLRLLALRLGMLPLPALARPIALTPTPPLVHAAPIRATGRGRTWL